MYGIEIEHGTNDFDEDDMNEKISGYVSTNFWTLKTDCSVGFKAGLETVSKIPFELNALENETLFLAKTLRELGSHTDEGRTSGIHIHIGMEEFSRVNCYTLRQLISELKLSANDGFFRKLFGRNDGSYHDAKLDEPDYKFQRCSIRTCFKTIEIRAFASTFDEKQLSRYFKFVRFCSILLAEPHIPTDYSLYEGFKAYESMKELVCV
jgi:hypothetical protein